MRQWVRTIMRRLASPFRRRQLDATLDDEIRTHLDLLSRDYERRGLTREQAQRAAQRDFGNVARMKELHREGRGLPWLDVLRQDVVYATRQLRRAPGFAASAIVTLAVCIGANVAVFTVVDGVLVRPLTYPAADRLITLFARLDPFGRIPVSDRQVTAWRESSTSFEGIALIFGFNVNLSAAGEPERVAAARVSPELFRLLGAQPQLGRLLQDDEDRPGRDRVVLVTDGLWRRRFNADPSIVGRTMMLDGAAHEIVGVLSADFRFPRISHLYSIPGESARPDVWKPLALAADDPFSGLNFAAIGRLKSGVSIDRAQAELDKVARAVLEVQGPSNATIPGELVPLQEQITGRSRRGLELLLVAVGAVLLAACINVTNLILARSATRQLELAVRSAVGASRARLVRQLFTEGLVLTMAGGAAGTLVATFAVRALNLVAPLDIPRLDEIRIDARVLVYAVLISLVAAAIVAILPAWKVSGRAFQISPLPSGHAGETGRRGVRATQATLVAVQVSLTVVCVMAAALLLQSLVRLLTVDKGFETRRLVTATLDLAGPRYTGRHTAFQRELTDRLRQVPGVTSVAISNQQLLSGAGMNLRVLAEGLSVPVLERPLANFRTVNADFFATLGIPIVRGRPFGESEPTRVAVVSRSTAERLWPGEDAVGKRFRRGPDDAPPLEVVGVAADVRASRLDQAPGLIVYVPSSQFPIGQMALAVKTAIDPVAVIPAVRDVVRRLDPELPLSALGTMDDAVLQSVAERRFLTTLVLAFAAGALALAALGIYGVVSQGVVQRKAELGVRLALGASGRTVVGLVLGDVWAAVASGLAVGVSAALASASLLRSMLFDVAPYDSATLAGCCVGIAAVATLAAYIPARKASRLDPLPALRSR